MQVEDPLCPAQGGYRSEAYRAVRNIFACLVHESPRCVIDLVRNLHYLDPHSHIVIYNEGNRLKNLEYSFPFEQYRARLHPWPRPIQWGRSHEFALDCMQFALDQFDFDTLTIVDSDQLLVRAGYSHYLAQFLAGERDIGLLGNAPEPQATDTLNGPPWTMFREIALWQPFLQRLSGVKRPQVFWSFWPSTVFTAEAARALTSLYAVDMALQDLLRCTRIFATEEVILPTLVAHLGFKIVSSPCSYDYVHFRKGYTIQQIEAALIRPDVFWVHPISRQYENRLRSYIRSHFNDYELDCGPEPGQAESLPDRDVTGSAQKGPQSDTAQAQPGQPALNSVAKAQEPLVSCIMPTCNRREFVLQAIHYFMRQDYPNRELIVVDDGEVVVADLMPPDPQIRYVQLEHKKTIGAKRNLACEIAQGTIIVHWDDDDWMASWRLSYQVEALRQNQADLCGLNTLLHYDIATGQSWQYICPEAYRTWLFGNTLCYTRTFWQSNPFPDLRVGSDVRFVWSNRPKKVLVLPDQTFYVALIHPSNTSPKRTQRPSWHVYPTEKIQALLGSDWDFYTNLSQ